MSIINFANPIDDTIEFTSADAINFGTEFIAANIIFKQQGNNLLIKYIDPLVHNSELDPKSITLTNVSLDDFFNGNLQGNQFVFENGSEVIFPDESGILQRNGNSENDLLIGGSGPNIIYGGNGDVLDGGSGVNTYEFSLDSGINCIIQNTSNTFQSYSPDNTPPDTIDFSNVYSTDITNLYQSGTDLIICYGTNNQVTVTNFYSTSLNQIGQIQFADGSSWSSDFIQNTNFIFGQDNQSLDEQNSTQNNYISAGSGADVLLGGSADDTLIAGSASDTLDGGAGNNTYVYSAKSLTIDQTIAQTTNTPSQSDKVIFSNINSDSITGWSQEVNTDNLILTVALGSNSSSITIDNFYAYSNAISTLQFADTVWTVDFIKNTNYYNGINITGDITISDVNNSKNDYYIGSNGSDNFEGGTGNDTLTGGTLESTLSGGAGNDLLTGGQNTDAIGTNATNLFIGGTGDDTIQGGVIDNIYQFSKGDGTDTIIQTPTSTTPNDIIKFINISSNELTDVYQNDQNLVICYGDSDQITITDFFTEHNRITTIQFAGENRSWDAAFINRTHFEYHTNNSFQQFANNIQSSEPLYIVGSGGDEFLSGGSADDTIVAGSGNDTINGGAGNNTYEISNSGFTNTIVQDTPNTIEDSFVDRIIFNDVSSDQVTSWIKTGNDLIINFGVSSSVTVQNFYDPSVNFVGLFQFSDTTFGARDINSKIITHGAVTIGGDVIFGLNDTNNIIDGTSGNDTITGGNLANTIEGGQGNDILNGGTGNGEELAHSSPGDTYIFSSGDGIDIIHPNANYVDTLLFTNVKSNEAIKLHVEGTNDLLISYGTNHQDSVLITDYFINQSQKIQFSDLSSPWNFSDLKNHLSANFNAFTQSASETDAVATGNEDSTITITFEDLFNKSNATTNYGSVTGFKITNVTSGTLYIGTEPWSAHTNDTVDATHNAYWSPISLTFGHQAAFDVVAVTDNEEVSLSPVQAYIDVSHVNHAPTGSVGIDGEAVQDSTLTVNTALLVDSDGLATLNYQWLSDGVVIPDATSETFTLTQAEVGKAISVAVSYTDLNGLGTTESVTSTPTAAVSNVNDLPNGSVGIGGDYVQYSELTADTTSLADSDGLGPFSYQWIADGTAISDATSETYTLTQAEVGKAISVAVSYVDGFGQTETVNSLDNGGFLIHGAGVNVTNVNDLPTGGVTINGDAIQYGVITADTSTLADLDGLGIISYQWLADGHAINGANGATLSLSQNQIGKAISVQASYTDLLGAQESVTSAVTHAVSHVNTAVSGNVEITGTTDQYQTLRANNSLSDVDGLGIISYQWLADGHAINGANGATLSLSQNQVGKAISVQASYTDLLGTQESVTSAVTHAVSHVNTAVSGNVEITGTTDEYQTLRANNSLSDVDGLGTLNYQWFANNSEISGAHNAFYTLTQADVGKSISVKTSYTDLQGTHESITSADTSSVAHVNTAPIVKSIYSGPINDRTHGLEYIATYGDLINAFGTNANAGISHYSSNGHNEHRTVMFNGLEYIASYTDLMKAFGANIDAGSTHFITNGYNEHRSVTFNALEYIASYGDLIKAFGANADAGSTHFITNGYNEHRTVTFNALEYIASYGDLINAFGDNANAGSAHYITNGINEHRATNGFNVVQYLNNYADLKAQFGTDYQAAIDNYITTGYKAGRTDALISTAGNDTLTGGNGDNIINGGLGNDVLTGGSGVNKFVFDTTPNATTNLDTITNFVAGKDQIELSHSVFTALGQQGVLSADQFVAGDFNSGQTATNHIIYNSTSGGVYYDADGSGNSAAVEIAVVGTNLNLTAGDIHII